MVDTIEEAVHPLILANFIFGFGSFKRPLYNSKSIFRLFYTLFFWSVYVWAFNYVSSVYWSKIFNNFIISFTIIIEIFVTLIIRFLIIRKHKNFRMCIRKLTLVDSTLKELGIPNGYRQMQYAVKRMLITWCTIMSVTIVTDSLWIIEIFHDTKAMIAPLVMHYSLYTNAFMDIMFVALIRYVGSRFDKINDYIGQLSITEDCGLRSTWQKSPDVTRYFVGNINICKRTIWITMHLHWELCQIARDINSLFGLHITLQMLSYFIIIIMMCYFQFNVFHLTEIHVTKVFMLKLLLCTNAWIIIYAMKLILLNHICESVSAKAQEVKTAIHNLTDLIHFARMREEIFQFVLQLTFRPLEFTGIGMFCLGYKFIRKFFLWVITTIIFLIQVDTSSYRALILNEIR